MAVHFVQAVQKQGEILVQVAHIQEREALRKRVVCMQALAELPLVVDIQILQQVFVNKFKYYYINNFIVIMHKKAHCNLCRIPKIIRL